MRIPSLFVLFLVGCAAPLCAAEVIVPNARLAVILPDSWHEVAEKKTGILLRAETDGGRVRFALARLRLLGQTI